jgi:hypothetical protein
MDIKHGEIQEEVEMIGRFVLSKILKNVLESSELLRQPPIHEMCI